MILLYWLNAMLSVSYLEKAVQSSWCTNPTLPNLSPQHYAWKTLVLIICMISCNIDISYTLRTVWWCINARHRVEAFLACHRLAHSCILAPCPLDSFGISFSITAPFSFIFFYIYFIFFYFEHSPPSALTWDPPPLHSVLSQPSSWQISLPLSLTFWKRGLHSKTHTTQSFCPLNPCSLASMYIFTGIALFLATAHLPKCNSAGLLPALILPELRCICSSASLFLLQNPYSLDFCSIYLNMPSLSLTEFIFFCLPLDYWCFMDSHAWSASLLKLSSLTLCGADFNHQQSFNHHLHVEDSQV